MRAYALALAVALAVGIVAGPVVRAEEATPKQIVILLRADEAAGRDLLAKALEPLRGQPEAIADLAVDLIGRLEGDPIENLAIATAIADASGIELHAEPVVRIAVDPDYRLPEGALGWDLGPEGAPPMPGFAAVTEDDVRLAGLNLEGMRFAGADPLLTDGVRGVRHLSLPAPNGDYEVLLLASEIAQPTPIGAPFGRVVTVNGRKHPLIGPETAGWMGLGALTGDTDRVAALTGQAIGGAISVFTTIENDMLDVTLAARDDEPTFLVAIILKPVAAPAQIVLDQPTAEMLAKLAERVAAAEERIAGAIANLLAGVASAAGIEDRVSILSLEEQPLPLEDALSVSPE